MQFNYCDLPGENPNLNELLNHMSAQQIFLIPEHQKNPATPTPEKPNYAQKLQTIKGFGSKLGRRASEFREVVASQAASASNSLQRLRNDGKESSRDDGNDGLDFGGYSTADGAMDAHVYEGKPLLREEVQYCCDEWSVEYGVRSLNH